MQQRLRLHRDHPGIVHRADASPHEHRAARETREPGLVAGAD